MAKDKNRAVFIGEETGGGYYGNTSGIIQSFILPNSKLIARLNFIKYVNDRKDKKARFGRGVFPDYSVKPTQQSITKGIDVEFEYVLELINSKK